MATPGIIQDCLSNFVFQLSLVVAVPLFLGLYRLSCRRQFPSTAPKVAQGNYPICGAIRFFTERWSFCEQAARSASGNYAFHLGKHSLIGVSGEEERKVFYQSKQLGFAEAYKVMSGQAPDTPNSSDGDAEFNKYFTGRIKTMLKRENILQGLPQLVKDARSSFEHEIPHRSGTMNPFEVIYETVYQMTMRTVACNEIANDPALLKKTLYLFEIFEKSGAATGIIFPWLPTPAKVWKFYAGVSLYMILDKIVKNRKKTGRRESDPLQLMIDEGDDMKQMIGFIIGSLFAGQVQSGIIGAWVLSYLAENPQWMTKAREEVTAVMQRQNPDSETSLIDQLANLPLDTWESEFKFLECCLNDGIRLQLTGTAFRKNTSSENIRIGNEVVPPGTFMTYHLGHVHHDPEVYTNPSQWDPSRYFEGRAEDRKVPFAFLGWGAGRHPCLGKRFARLEITVLLVHFIVMFDECHLSDKAGNFVAKLPPPNRESNFTAAASRPVYIKVHRREK